MWERVSPRLTVWRVTVGLGLGLGVVTVGRVELLLELVEPRAVAEASAAFERVWKKAKRD